MATEPWKAHLNGGPYDDWYMVTEQIEIRVAKIPRIMTFNMDDEGARNPEDLISLDIGIYRMRFDAFNQPVPHNLDGVVEFDWQM